MSDTPLTDALTTVHYNSACADAAGMGTEILCEQAYGEVVDLAKTLESRLAASEQARERAELGLAEATKHCAFLRQERDNAIDAQRKAEAELAALKAATKSAKVIIDLLELGDTRLMAGDGPCGGQLPELSPEEWGRVYRACKKIAKFATVPIGKAK